MSFPVFIYPPIYFIVLSIKQILLVIYLSINLSNNLSRLGGNERDQAERGRHHLLLKNIHQDTVAGKNLSYIS